MAFPDGKSSVGSTRSGQYRRPVPLGAFFLGPRAAPAHPALLLARTKCLRTRTRARVYNRPGRMSCRALAERRCHPGATGLPCARFARSPKTGPRVRVAEAAAIEVAGPVNS